MKILSLGAGVQSTTVLLMSCKGELPKLDAAIFADTGWEPKAVYEHLEWLKKESEKHGIPVHIVSIGNIRENHLKAKFRVVNTKEGRYQLDMPLYSRRGDDRGLTRRQCTREYKIRPIEEKLRELLGYKKGERIKNPDGEPLITQWMGISTDEVKRARISEKKWLEFHYPLITDLKMDRNNCIFWLKNNYPERYIPRSACVGCPYHTNAEWRRMKNEDKESWNDAVLFDNQIRNLDVGKDEGLEGELYLHQKCIPLEEVDFSTPEDNGQMNWLDECMGMCGV